MWRVNGNISSNCPTPHKHCVYTTSEHPMVMLHANFIRNTEYKSIWLININPRTLRSNHRCLFFWLSVAYLKCKSAMILKLMVEDGCKSAKLNTERPLNIPVGLRLVQLGLSSMENILALPPPPYGRKVMQCVSSLWQWHFDSQIFRKDTYHGLLTSSIALT